MRAVLVLVLASFLAACAQQPQVKLYPGAERAPAQLLLVKVPRALEIDSINGEKVSAQTSVIRADMQELQLLPGDYIIHAYYKNLHDVNGVDSEMIRSRIAIFTLGGQAGETWTLNYQEPQNIEQARATRDGLKAWATNQSGQRIDAQTGAPVGSLITELFAGSSATPIRERMVTPLSGTSRVNTVHVKAPLQANAPAAGLPQLPDSDATLVTLQQLWLMLSPESRQAFLQWAEQ